MQFDDQNIDTSQLEDRRGGGGIGGLALGGGGLGIVGLIVALLLGVNPFSGGGTGGGSGTGVAPGTSVTSDVGTRCRQAGAIEQYEDCYVLKVFNEINEVWTNDLPRQGGGSYHRPTLVFFTQATQTGCGGATAEVGPFYCPADERVYLDLGFLDELQQRFGAQGRYAQAYIVAHEVGHHLQNLLGTERKVRSLQQQDPSQQNRLSVRLELQADCYAGVYGRLANDQGNQVVTPADVNEALNAAAAVGDDRIQRASGQAVNSETFTHGSAQQRASWYRTGFSAGQLARCSTFSS